MRLRLSLLLLLSAGRLQAEQPREEILRLLGEAKSICVQAQAPT